MFDRISRGFKLALSSWNVLYTDKKLIVFPILSGISCLLVLASFFIPIAVLVNNGTIRLEGDENTGLPIWGWAVLFAFYFVNYFVIVFFNSALVSCSMMRFNGQQPTIAAGLSAASSRLPQILAWAFVSASVGILLRFVESLNEKVGAFISKIIGTAWTVLTFFVVPVLVVEKVGPFQAVSRSFQLLRQSWGESLVGSVGLGLFQFLLVLPGFLAVGGGIYLMASLAPAALGATVLVLGLLYLLLAFAVSAALDTIFVSAVYQFAANKTVPQGFDADTIEHAFEPRKAAA